MDFCRLYEQHWVRQSVRNFCSLDHPESGGRRDPKLNPVPNLSRCLMYQAPPRWQHL